MTAARPEPASPETPGVVTVRYWAAARAASGVATEDWPVTRPVSLAEVVEWAVSRHPGTRLPEVLAVCSVLVGDRPVGTLDPDVVMVESGATVEFLPPFAGG